MAKMQRKQTAQKRAIDSVEQQKKRQKRRRVITVVLILAVLITMVILSLTVLFKIENITVTGIDRYSTQEIIDSSGIVLDSNMFLVPKKEVINDLMEEYPYLDSVKIHWDFPPAIQIQGVQTVPIAALQISDNEYALINEKGKVLERGFVLIPPEVILIKGFSIGDKQPGDYLGEYTPQAKGENETLEEIRIREDQDTAGEAQAAIELEYLRMMNYLLQAEKDSGIGVLTNADFTDNYNILVYYDNRMTLELGSESDLTYKLRYAKSILEENLSPQAHGTLHLADADTKIVTYLPAEGYRKDGSPMTGPVYNPEMADSSDDFLLSNPDVVVTEGESSEGSEEEESSEE